MCVGTTLLGKCSGIAFKGEQSILVKEQDGSTGIMRPGCGRESEGTSEKGLAFTVDIIGAGELDVVVFAGVYCKVIRDIGHGITGGRGTRDVDGHGENGGLIDFIEGCGVSYRDFYMNKDVFTQYNEVRIMLFVCISVCVAF